MYRHRIMGGPIPIPTPAHFEQIKRNDKHLSKINKVYFVTKQVPQNETTKPELAYLPIIHQTPSIYQDKSVVMSSALLSSVHSMDLDTFKVNKFFNTVIAPKSNKNKSLTRSLSSGSLVKKHQSRNQGTVINVPNKSNEGLFIKNSKPATVPIPIPQYRLKMDQQQNKLDVPEMKSSSTSLIRGKSSRTVHSRALTYHSYDNKDSLSHSAQDLSRMQSNSTKSLMRSTSTYMLASSENFKNYRMVVKKLDR